MGMREDFVYVREPGALTAACNRLAGADVLCVDTEFLRDKTYYPKLCLVQIAADDEVLCIDPLAVGELTPLLDLLYDPGNIKVFHAARQDLEIFYHLRGALPAPVFDTQIAAALLGANDQIGYGALVQQVLGVELDKAHSRTDWSARPLQPEQLQYAAEDVIHLCRLYERQVQILGERGRLDWLREDFATLTDPATYAPDPDGIWRRLKDVRRLKGVQLAALQRLAAWREHHAMASDRPRRWIVRDEILVDLARHMPASMAAMGRIRGLEERLLQRHGGTLLGLLQEARELPREDWPTLEPRRILEPHQDALVDAMMAIVRLRATEESLSPAMLATRATLERLVAGDPDAAVLHGWRAALVGCSLQEFAEGRAALEVRNGRLGLASPP